MRVTIKTRYSGPTNTRGSRIIARGMGRQLTLPYRYDLNSDARQFDAVRRLRDRIETRDSVYLQFRRETAEGFEFDLWDQSVARPHDNCRFCGSSHAGADSGIACDAVWDSVFWIWAQPSAAERRAIRAAERAELAGPIASETASALARVAACAICAGSGFDPCGDTGGACGACFTPAEETAEAEPPMVRELARYALSLTDTERAEYMGRLTDTERDAVADWIRGGL